MTRLAWIAVCAFFFPLTALAQNVESTSIAKPGYIKFFEKGNWATLRLSDGAYQVRVMSAEQKSKAEKAIAAYQTQREAYVEYAQAQRQRQRAFGGLVASETQKPETEKPEAPPKVDRPSIAADLASGEFYQIVDAQSDYVELQTDETHLILPIASIRVIVLGEKGMLGAPSRAPSAFSRGGFSQPRR